MAMQRMRLKLGVTVVMVNLFIFILIFRHSGQDKNGHHKVRIPSAPFWSKLTPPLAYWNRQQQVVDIQNNPVLAANYSATDLRLTEDSLTSDPCTQNMGVTTQVKDYNSLPERFKDFLHFMHCRSYPIVLDQPDICEEPPFLLLAIKSQVSHFDRRQAIRQSWGRAGVIGNQTVVTVFLLGNATAWDHHPDLSFSLRDESLRHQDIIQWDFRDSFFNLTVKEVLFLEWIQTRCPGARFIFKGDDDVFVNTYRILDFLKGLTEPKARDLFVGDVITEAGPHRDKKVKYFIPESLYTGKYPPYAGGGGYFYSGEVAARLHSVSRRVLLFPIDDVYTGMCLKKLGLGPERHKGFRTFDIEAKYRSNPCAYNSLILVHPRTPQQIIQIWAWLNSPDLNCQ
ncbi:putative UDP-GlcNAc:betaGal beta-1-3-N-acetylglucosaminyltransferase 2-like [Scophthalmus maximus]|uniref:Hexosyltransferase n=1 Tax=Scophthalmus maximus TaxID=52904 RepID=A0A2U9CIJ5_SCOMX|nr:N-acetyllactosaminide beta-1,3-N-acetylglucosaminyltransferase 2 [Scophthalmus maximus]XP_035460960.1 N-acetyllactosaminide beta-1,3-N-acetylglucosaminyltransferase 2 [Scophthalmus maximus]XP_035460961.1 N-acetyllactosaminide beta-1,3-N-acetylglucosaminyltransferase 2 [Scophthalmus maximus]XP_035460963.1 N-acetyllactosaminide beta-1,3-N-acetylglucosaminyltransferase 2 [Scophthalmus maximus]XP_035460964.1 N-acetyllactosaminide beta-1,3-N-acetylglucosaminyltransferase 2 [Scophthalmus maximus]